MKTEELKRIDVYFRLRVKYPTWTKSKCKEQAGYARKTNVSVIESNPKFITLMAEYSAKLKEYKRDVSERIHEAMSLYNGSARDVIEKLSDIMNNPDAEFKDVISASKQLTEVTQDKNKQQSEIAMPGIETALEALFT